VIANLLSNAVKFTPRGGRVQLRVARVHSSVEVRVEDSGSGIDPTQLPAIFDRYRQVEPGAQRQQRGLGVGLSIVRHIVELHGGTVEALSAGRGRGATFVVQLPVMIVSPWDAERVAVEPQLVIDEPPSLNGLRVLVVDDDPDARGLVATVLERQGAAVDTAESGEQAMELLRSGRPDVLLSDIEMPREDGYALIRRVRGLPADEGGTTPAAAFTAYARTEDRMQALLAGFQIHVPKPVQPAELIAVVSSLAARKAPPVV
jgi:CheY-like chemotaxis protein